MRLLRIHITQNQVHRDYMKNQLADTIVGKSQRLTKEEKKGQLWWIVRQEFWGNRSCNIIFKANSISTNPSSPYQLYNKYIDFLYNEVYEDGKNFPHKFSLQSDDEIIKKSFVYPKKLSNFIVKKVVTGQSNTKFGRLFRYAVLEKLLEYETGSDQDLQRQGLADTEKGNIIKKAIIAVWSNAITSDYNFNFEQMYSDFCTNNKGETTIIQYVSSALLEQDQSNG